MPISVQIISHAFEDEKALAVMQSLDKQIKFRMPNFNINTMGTVYCENTEQ